MFVPVWGWTEPGSQVTLKFADQKKTATADGDGKWLLRLDPMQASRESRDLTISSTGQSVTLKDVLVGEVWLASGQSNMGFTIPKSTYADEARKLIPKLQKEYKRLEQRLEAMYVDKLDGKIGERFYEQKSAEWREDQKDIRRRLEEHENASKSYMDEGIALMELANRAADLFAEQPASENRRLLEFVLSNSFWAGGELTPEFRQPFDMLADMATVGAQKMATGLLTSSHHQEELPEGNSLRNSSRIPDFRNTFIGNSLLISRLVRLPKTEGNHSETGDSRVNDHASFVVNSRPLRHRGKNSSRQLTENTCARE